MDLISMEDVRSFLLSCRYHILALCALLILTVAALILMRKIKNRPVRKLAMAQSLAAFLVGIVIIFNLLMTGPLQTLASLAATQKLSLSEDSLAQGYDLNERIAEEGIVLLKNDGLLPMQAETLNVFGWASAFPLYGGTGSGSMSDQYDTISLLQGLESAGISTNSELTGLYTTYRDARPKLGVLKQDWSLPEPPADSYPDTMLSAAADFSDKAMIVLARSGGEGADLPLDMKAEAILYDENSEKYEDFEPGQNYLSLSHTERDLIEMVCSRFDDVILVYNGANTLELGFVNEYPQIKSVLWCPGPGQAGFQALGRILTGSVNPSGKTTDIFPASLASAPYYNNFGDFVYDNMEHVTIKTITSDTLTPGFVNYVEGIYVGYRFYETAAEEGLIDYAAQVVYPFGYGLSYTSFSQEMGDLTVSDGEISFDVTVTNTGSTAGKDVVQVYFTPPYTNGGIEKSAVNLAAFAKTGMIDPGSSETVTIRFAVEDMASYEYAGAGCYVLEQGDYIISLRSDSHTVLAEQTFVQQETVAYDAQNPRSTDTEPAVNRLGFAGSDIEYLSRKDGFANYESAIAAPENYTLAAEYADSFLWNENYDPANYNDPEDVMPVTGAKNGVKLADLTGLSYDDPMWDSLLDELTVEEMNNLIALAGYQTGAIERIGKLQTTDCDGPASINNNFNGTSTIGFPCGVMLACTWNVDLAGEFGSLIGIMANEIDVTGWDAPAMNIHRSAFNGRNFEYYSEDGLLSGKMAAATIREAMQHGIYCYIKHFALNEQETRRASYLCTWFNEQSAREIYLRPFELAVKEGGATAVMSAMNFIGTTPAMGCDELLNQILRGEWGFRGMVLTDTFNGRGAQYSDRFIRNGNDAMLTNGDFTYNFIQDQQSATSVLAMRQAAKNILYTTANSRLYQGEAGTQQTSSLSQILMVVNICAAVLLVLIEAAALLLYRKRSRETNG